LSQLTGSKQNSLQFFNKLNTKRLALEIRRITKQLEFENYILFNDSSMFRGVYLKELLKPALSIYYIRDNLITQDYFKGMVYD
jgi:hypothetical protein